MATRLQERPSEALGLNGGHVRIRSVSGGLIDLFQSDCLLGMRELAAESIALVVTSPPYNLGVAYGRYDDAAPRAEYLQWISAVFRQVREKMADDGSLFLNLGSAPTNPWGPFEVITVLRSLFTLQNVIHWIKSIYVENEAYGKKTSMNVGHYKPINSPRFVNDTHEYVFHLTKSGEVPLDRLSVGVPYKDQGNVNRWKDGSNGIRCRGNCWYIPYKTIQSRADERPHPASFPSELAEMCIRLQGRRASRMRVLDPFMGIGNTALAASRLGVDCVGFEIDEDYFAASVRLLQGA